MAISLLCAEQKSMSLFMSGQTTCMALENILQRSLLLWFLRHKRYVRIEVCRHCGSGASMMIVYRLELS